MTYYLADGTECTIERLCREEPLWAASVIPHLTQACDALAADKAKLLAAMDLNERTDAEGEARERALERERDEARHARDCYCGSAEVLLAERDAALARCEKMEKDLAELQRKWDREIPCDD
jgi:hypothetical protein